MEVVRFGLAAGGERKEMKLMLHTTLFVYSCTAKLNVHRFLLMLRSHVLQMRAMSTQIQQPGKRKGKERKGLKMWM